MPAKIGEIEKIVEEMEEGEDKEKKILSFQVCSYDKNVFIPLDDLDNTRSFTAKIIINQGHLGNITRVGKCIRQRNGKFKFSAKLTYNEAPKDAKGGRVRVKNYDPCGRYGDIYQ